jgi:glycosyltransferase involved in cell wall biosynthesis
MAVLVEDRNRVRGSTPMSQAESGRRLKIAVLNRGFMSRAGGAENYSISLVEMLAERHEVHVFTQHLDHDYPGVTYHVMPQCVRKPSWIDLLCFNIRTRRATRYGFDIVHSHENTWHGQVQTVHVRPVKVGLFHGRRGFRRFLRYVQIATSPRLWTYLLIERARMNPVAGKAVIACSEPLRQELEKAYPALQGKTLLLPPGVHLPEPARADERSAIRQELGIPEQAFVLLFVGNDYAKKGLGPLLQAVRVLPVDTVLVVVGNSAHIPEFSKLAEALGVANQVRFVGGVSSVHRYYQAADANVHPTTEDSFSMVVLEALAHGLPVAVSGPSYCGIAANLKDGTDALILNDPRDVGEMVATLQRLHDDAPLRTRLGEAGLRLAAQFGWAELARQQVLIYEKALGH